eukprot:8915769-Alexandrium_andersonii.AAC.1
MQSGTDCGADERWADCGSHFGRLAMYRSQSGTLDVGRQAGCGRPLSASQSASPPPYPCTG